MDIKLAYSTNPLLLSGMWIAFAEFELGPDLAYWPPAFVCFNFFFYFIG